MSQSSYPLGGLGVLPVRVVLPVPGSRCLTVLPVLAVLVRLFLLMVLGVPVVPVLRCRLMVLGVLGVLVRLFLLMVLGDLVVLGVPAVRDYLVAGLASIVLQL